MVQFRPTGDSMKAVASMELNKISSLGRLSGSWKPIESRYHVTTIVDQSFIMAGPFPVFHWLNLWSVSKGSRRETQEVEPPGYRLGYLAAPKEIVKAASKLQSQILGPKPALRVACSQKRTTFGYLGQCYFFLLDQLSPEQFLDNMQRMFQREFKGIDGARKLKAGFS